MRFILVRDTESMKGARQSKNQKKRGSCALYRGINLLVALYDALLLSRAYSFLSLTKDSSTLDYMNIV